MSDVAALLFMCIGLAAPAWSRAKTGDFLRPGPLVISVWSLTFGLYLLRLLPYPQLSMEAALAVVIGVSSLLAGISAATKWKRGTSSRERTRPRLQRWLTVYGILGIAGLSWYVYSVHRALGWDAFVVNSSSIRVALGNYTIPSTFLFLEFFCIITPVLGVAVVLSGERLPRWQWVIIALCCAGTWISTDRTQFFTIVLSCFFVYLYRHGPRLTFTRFSLALTLAAVLLASNFLIVGYWLGKTGEKLGISLGASAGKTGENLGISPGASAGNLYASRRDENPTTAAVRVRAAALYLYATGSYAALGVWMEQDHRRTYGLQAVYPVARLLQRAHLLSTWLPPAIPEFVPVARTGENSAVGFNGYTFLYSPLQDFGIGGVIVYCLAIGLLSGVVYRRMTETRGWSPLYLLMSSQIAAALVLSVFVNKFNNTASWYVFVLTTAPFTVSAVMGAHAPSGDSSSVASAPLP